MSIQHLKEDKGKIRRSKVFNTPGTYTFKVPNKIAKNSDGTYEVNVTGCGAGGGWRRLQYL